MTQPATNAQVALQCATTLRASKNSGGLASTWNETSDLFSAASGLLKWLDAHTPPTPDPTRDTRNQGQIAELLDRNIETVQEAALLAYQDLAAKLSTVRTTAAAYADQPGELA